MAGQRYLRWVSPLVPNLRLGTRANGLLILLVLAMATPQVGADGGTLRLSQTHDGLNIAVFTSPTPLRAGTVDVSVLLQDAKSGAVLLDVPVDVRAISQGDPRRTASSPAKSQLATNKLFRAVHLELPEPGIWHIDLQILRDEQPIEIGFDVELAGPPPPWLDLVLWLSWPVVVIGLFVIHLILRRRVMTRPPAS